MMIICINSRDVRQWALWSTLTSEVHGVHRTVPGSWFSPSPSSRSGCSDVAPSMSRRGGEGRCCSRCLYCRALRSVLLPLCFEFRWVLTAKWSGPGLETWLDIWKSSARFRGLPGLLSLETPQFLHRLQTARLCNKETVSADRDITVGHAQHRCGDCYLLPNLALCSKGRLLKVSLALNFQQN